MTTADARSPEPAADTAADIEDTGTFQVLVSYYGAEGGRTVRQWASPPTDGRVKKLWRW